MPVHDWTRVDAGIFHDFYNVWIAELRNALNRGILPQGYYALIEQHMGRSIPDVLTLDVRPPETRASANQPAGGLALADAPPRVQRKITAEMSLRGRRRSLALRHVSGHRLVALIEIVSPSNKDRRDHVEQFASKIISALDLGVHVLLIDLFPPGRYDPAGMHEVVWSLIEESENRSESTPGTGRTLASYVAGPPVDAYLADLSVGGELPEMPLFLQTDRYINVPLEAAYQTAFSGEPEFWREVLERP